MAVSASSRKGKSPPARPEPAPRKWRRRAQVRPAEILDAALDEFTERGFDAARMEDVAKRAGISKAGVYLYFESKEALLKALIEARVTPLVQTAVSAAAPLANDPKAALRMIAATMARKFAEPQNFAVPRLVLSLCGRFPEIAAYYRTHVAEVGRAMLERLIAAGVASGAFRAVDPKAAARAFVGPLLFEALWTHILRGESALGDPQALVDSQLDILLEGLERRA